MLESNVLGDVLGVYVSASGEAGVSVSDPAGTTQDLSETPIHFIAVGSGQNIGTYVRHG